MDTQDNLNKYILKYFDYLEYERKLSENTLKSYHNDLKKFNNYFKGDVLNLEYNDIQKYIVSLSNEDARTIAHYITVINSFYDFLVDENIIKDILHYVTITNVLSSDTVEVRYVKKNIK